MTADSGSEMTEPAAIANNTTPSSAGLRSSRPLTCGMREAQLAMKAKYSDPFYWGAFICQGDPSPLGAAGPKSDREENAGYGSQDRESQEVGHDRTLARDRYGALTRDSRRHEAPLVGGASFSLLRPRKLSWS